MGRPVLALPVVREAKTVAVVSIADPAADAHQPARPRVDARVREP